MGLLPLTSSVRPSVAALGSSAYLSRQASPGQPSEEPASSAGAEQFAGTYPRVPASGLRCLAPLTVICEGELPVSAWLSRQLCLVSLSELGSTMGCAIIQRLSMV